MIFKYMIYIYTKLFTVLYIYIYLNIVLLFPLLTFFGPGLISRTRSIQRTPPRVHADGWRIYSIRSLANLQRMVYTSRYPGGPQKRVFFLVNVRLQMVDFLYPYQIIGSKKTVISRLEITPLFGMK